MVNYGETLRNSSIPEWQDRYMDYDDLKYIVEQLGIVDTLLEQAMDEKQTYVYRQMLVDLDAYLWDQLEEQMDSVEGFFNQQLDKLKLLIQEIKQQFSTHQMGESRNRKQIVDIKQNIQEVYKTITLLGTFSVMNLNGFRKIVKKRNKMAKTHIPDGQGRYQFMVQQRNFPKEQLVFDQQYELEEIWGAMEHINKKDARTDLMTYCSTKVNAERIRIKSATASGLTLGLAIMVIVYFCFTMYQLQLNTVKNIFEGHDIMLLFIRAQSLLLFHFLLLGMDIYCCEKRRLNYIFILEIPPSQVVSSYRGYFQKCLIYIIVYCVFTLLATCRLVIQEANENGLLFQIHGELIYGWLLYVAQFLPKEVWLCVPLAVIVVAQATKYVVLKCRHAQGHSIQRVIISNILKQFAPWRYRVSFPVFFIGDQLTSITQLFGDLIYIISFGYAPDYVQLLFINIPAIIRIVQCYVRYREKFQVYPHITNMFKYVSSIPGTLLVLRVVQNNRVALIIFNLFKAIEMIYKCYWDIAEDWALFTGGTGVKEFAAQPSKWQNRILCRRTSFFQNRVLAVCCVNNIAARWAFLVPFAVPGLEQTFSYKTFLIALEICRRCIWNVLRIDNQQATNCEGYALTRYIPVLLSQNERQDMQIRHAEIMLGKKGVAKAKEARGGEDSTLE